MNWIIPLLDHCNANHPVTYKELGGIEKEDGMEHQVKKLEKEYDA